MTSGLVFPTFTDTFALSGDYRFTTEPIPAGTANTLPTEVVTGLVDFIPRVPSGFTWYVSNFQVEGHNEVQVVGFVGTPTAGTFKLGYPATSPVWTSALPYGTTNPATIQAALQGLSSIGAGNVSVTTDTSSLGDWDVEFTGALALQNAAMIQTDTTLLTNATMGVQVLVPGAPVVLRDTAFMMDPVFNARIWEGRLSTIDVADTPGYHLPAATTAVLQAVAAVDPEIRKELQMPSDQLVFDVRHRNVVFADSDQSLQNYAIAALAVGQSMVLTSPATARLPYRPRPDVPPA